MQINTFRAGDRVMVTAKDEFYAYIDGWCGRVLAVGPAKPNPVHSQVPEGHCAVSTDGRKDGERCVFLVPVDQLALTVGR